MGNEIKIIQGKCEEVLQTFPDNYFDSVVTDPPYGIGFMGKAWDTFKGEYLQDKREAESKRRPRSDGRKSTGFGDSVYAGTYDLSLSANIKYQQWYCEIMKEVIRVLKPGGHIISACGTRTYHRMACGIEDAGFEIRDVITWHYGSGFPKSLDISKAIDKQAGAERENTRELMQGHTEGRNRTFGTNGEIYGSAKEAKAYITLPATDQAKQWNGCGTGLKPATEFWTLARKPLSENTVAENVLKHGTGGINIDGCRIETFPESFVDNRETKTNNVYGKYNPADYDGTQGRFPANLILYEFAAAELDKQSGISTSTDNQRNNKSEFGKTFKYSNDFITNGFADSGGASRFFYVAKPSQFEREKGLKGFKKQQVKHIATQGWDPEDNPNYPRSNFHPTVKPIELMRYLVRLVTPKHGICLDPFCGSGTTLIACKLELMNGVGIDMDQEHCELAEARVASWNPERYIEQTLF